MGGSATAAVLITSADIKDGTIKPADMSAAGRTAIKGAPCTIPDQGNGKIQMQTLGDGRIVFFCKNGFTTDNDGDSFTEAQGDCDDTDAARSPEALEQFNGLDDDCDGGLFAGPYYTGPPMTDGVGICHAGEQQETPTPPYSEITVPQQLPEVEVAGDGVDNDCDGVADEG
jgi:hypothetical protein